MKIALIAAAMLPLAAIANAKDFEPPHAGSCRNEALAGPDVVDWRGEEATLHIRGKSLSGQVVGMRKHGKTGLKFSVRYEDSIMGPTELVVFRSPDDPLGGYRMATVYFERVEGDLMISSVFGFEGVSCAVIYN